jgi:hypothetical protein
MMFPGPSKIPSASPLSVASAVRLEFQPGGFMIHQELKLTGTSNSFGGMTVYSPIYWLVILVLLGLSVWVFKRWVFSH